MPRRQAGGGMAAVAAETLGGRLRALQRAVLQLLGEDMSLPWQQRTNVVPASAGIWLQGGGGGNGGGAVRHMASRVAPSPLERSCTLHNMAGNQPSTAVRPCTCRLWCATCRLLSFSPRGCLWLHRLVEPNRRRPPTLGGSRPRGRREPLGACGTGYTPSSGRKAVQALVTHRRLGLRGPAGPQHTHRTLRCSMRAPPPPGSSKGKGWCGGAARSQQRVARPVPQAARRMTGRRRRSGCRHLPPAPRRSTLQPRSLQRSADPPLSIN